MPRTRLNYHWWYLSRAFFQLDVFTQFHLCVDRLASFCYLVFGLLEWQLALVGTTQHICISLCKHLKLHDNMSQVVIVITWYTNINFLMWWIITSNDTCQVVFSFSFSLADLHEGRLSLVWTIHHICISLYKYIKLHDNMSQVVIVITWFMNIKFFMW
jgi:hypothetical protein